MLRVVGSAGVVASAFIGVALISKFAEYEHCNIGSHHKNTYDLSSTVYAICVGVFAGIGTVGVWFEPKFPQYVSYTCSVLLGLAFYLAIFAGATSSCHISSAPDDDRFPRYNIFSPSVFVASVFLSFQWIKSTPPSNIRTMLLTVLTRFAGFTIWVAAPTLPQAVAWENEQALVALEDVSVYKNSYFYAVALVGMLLSAAEFGLLYFRHRFINFFHFVGIILTGAYLWGICTANSLWKNQISHHNYNLVWGTGVIGVSLILDVTQLVLYP